MTLETTAEALLLSYLQPSDRLSAALVTEAVCDSVQAPDGLCGCAAASAAEYGEHPDTAPERMRWPLAVAADDAAVLAKSAGSMTRAVTGRCHTSQFLAVHSLADPVDDALQPAHIDAICAHARGQRFFPGTLIEMGTTALRLFWSPNVRPKLIRRPPV